MKDMNNIKQKMLEMNIVVDNDYLTKYLDLIKQNLTTAKIKGKTQKHHIIPLSVYKNLYKLKTREDVEKENYENFSVNLKYSDHILAHYYICLCSKTPAVLYSNFKSISFIFQNKVIEKNLKLELKNMFDQFISKLPDYEKIYEEVSKLQSKKSKETIAKNKKIHSKETREKINQTIARNKPLKEKHFRVYLNDIEKVIPSIMLNTYISNGWKRGRSLKYVSSNQNYYQSKKGKHFSSKTEFKKGMIGKNLGKSLSEEIRLKMSLAKKGKIGLRKGAKLTDEQKKKLSDAHKGLESKKKKAVLQFDLNGKCINEWTSISEATLQTGVNNIIAVCKGKNKTSGGFVWKYKE